MKSHFALPSFVAAFHLCLVTSAAALKEYQTWVGELAGKLESSSNIQDIRAGMDAAKHSLAGAREELPLTWSVSASRNDTQSWLPNFPKPLDVGYSLTNQLQYQTHIGFNATLNTSVGYDQLNNVAFLSGLKTSTRNYTASLQVSYDLLKGGYEGAAYTQEKIDYFTALKRLASLRQQLFDEQLRAYGVFTDVYTGICKVRELREAVKVVEKIVSTGKVKLEAKLISTKDFLNFLNTQSSIAQRIANQEASLAVTRQRLLGFGRDLFEAAAKLEAKSLSCIPDLTGTRERARGVQLDSQKVSVLLPSYEEAKATSELAQLQLQLTKKNLDPSLKPFVSASYTKTPDSSTQKEQEVLSAGVTFVWVLPFDQAYHSEESAKLTAKAAAKRLEKSLVEGQSTLNSLRDRVSSQDLILGALDFSVETANRLVRTLELGLEAGSTDSLNYNNAQIAKIDAKQALLEAWATLEKALFEVSQYKRYEQR